MDRWTKNVVISGLCGLVFVGCVVAIVKHREEVAKQQAYKLALDTKQKELKRAEMAKQQAITTMKNFRWVSIAADPNNNADYIDGEFQMVFTINNTGSTPMKLNMKDFQLVNAQNKSEVKRPVSWNGENGVDWSNVHTFKPHSTSWIGLMLQLTNSPGTYVMQFNHGGSRYGTRSISVNVTEECTLVGERKLQEYEASHQMSEANFEKIDSSYTVSMVNDLFSTEGTLSSEAGQGTDYLLQTYTWENSDGTEIVTIEFENGYESAKDEVGLQ